MKTNKLKTIMLLMGLLFSVSLSAFEVDGIEYQKISSIEVGVNKKGSGAFSEYSGDIVIPEHISYNGDFYKVTQINIGAFNSAKITSISIPKTVTSINCDFRGISTLTSVYISDLSSWFKIKFNSYNNPCFSASHFYVNGEELTDLIVPEDVIDIQDYMFYKIQSIKSITLSNTVTSIGKHAFYQCRNLTSVNFGNRLEKIGEEAFWGCSNLSSLNIPSSVITIEPKAFEGCGGLNTIVVDKNNKIYDSRDNCNALIESESNTLIRGCNNTTIPNNIAFIKESSFNYCENLNSVNIPEGVTSIDDYTFSECSGLFSVSLPNTLTNIGSYAFQRCRALSSIIIPQNVTTIGYAAFVACSSLTAITIPINVTSMENAFSLCNNLIEVTVENPNPIRITYDTFSNLKNSTLYVPKGSKAAYEAADYWKEFKEIVEIAESNYLEISDTTAFCGKQLILPINLTNKYEIAGVQFKLTLPQGVSVALNSKNKLMFSKTERDADHTLSGSKAEDGSYTVLLYSADSEAITGNEGSIIDVTLDIDKEMKDGTYEIKISDIVLSTTKAVKINGDDVTAQLEVKSYLLGDPNNDGSIDVVDITMIANHILGNNPENFIVAAADVDVDGTVDVNDIISIANIILYGSSSNAKPSMAKVSSHLANNVTSNESNGDGFTVKNVSVEKGGTVKVDFELTNAAHDFSGIQMDIDLGEGLSFATKSNGKVNVTKGARLEDEDFTLSVAKQEGNQYRALGYYTDGSVIPEKSGTLFTLTLQADESLADGKTFNCQLDNITLSTKNNEKIQQETQTFTVTIGDATGISYLFNEDGTPAVMYDLTGKRIETPAKSGQVILIKKGGKVVKVFKK